MLIWSGKMKVKEAMNKGVITINPDIKPLEAFEKMYKEGVRRLFVMDEKGNPRGVVSYSDLIGVLGSIKPTTKEIGTLKIEDIMSEDTITISAADGIEDAANLMVRADVSGLLVLEDEKPVGVITKTDICRMVAAELLVPI
jgi:predicted transcriptional regulator